MQEKIDGDLSIVINQDGVKRKIDGPFEIYMDRRTLEILKKRFEELPENWSLGWITIFEKPAIRSIPNSSPLPWSQK